jgi:sulfite exporter TauE/SafE
MDLALSPFLLSSTPYITAFIAGLMGSVHCIGMCGGIVGALTYGLPESVRSSPAKLLPYMLSYNIGRITSYTLAGIVAGHLGNLAGGYIADYQGWMILRILAALIMITMGLYIGGWWLGLLRLENLGGHVWKHLQPIGQKLMPVTTLPHALLLGLVWGWLPCGLVYTMLIWTLASGGWQEGAMFMLSFGAGTLPALFVMGAASAWLGRTLHKPAWRKIAGATVIAFGLWTLISTLLVQANVGLGCAVPPR